LAAVLMRSWVRVYHRLQIRGQENLPLNESFVMVANHSSHLDTLCLLASLPLQRLHRAFPVAAQDYFFRKTPRTALAAITLNAMPFNRQTQVRRSLGRCREILWRPRNIVILFPEGTRSNTGEIGEF